MPLYRIEEDHDGDSGWTLTPWDGPIPKVEDTSGDFPPYVVDVPAATVAEYAAVRARYAALNVTLGDLDAAASEALNAQFEDLYARERAEAEAEEERAAAEAEAAAQAVDAVEGPREWVAAGLFAPSGGRRTIHHASCPAAPFAGPGSYGVAVYREAALRDWLTKQAPDTMEAHTCARRWEPDLPRYAPGVYATRDAGRAFAKLVNLLGDRCDDRWTAEKAKAMRAPRARDIGFLGGGYLGRFIPPDISVDLITWNRTLRYAIEQNRAEPALAEAVTQAYETVKTITDRERTTP